MLDIVFPDTDENLKSTESERIVIGCVGANHGLFVSVCCPSMKDGRYNAQAYFSGRYMAHSLNIQAICDIDCYFTFFGVIAPGKASNQVAFKRTLIYKHVMALPMGMYLDGDAAYQFSDVMLVSFTGPQRDNAGKDAFNFFLLQLNIPVEMAFGLLQTKWRALNRPLQVNLSTTARVIDSCARLHNFVFAKTTTAQVVSPTTRVC